MQIDLTGKTAIVTGASRPRGIGRAIAMRLARSGANVVVADAAKIGLPSRGEDKLRPVEGWRGVDSIAEEIEALGRQSMAVVADVSDESAVQSLAARVAESFGTIDILVNNAAAPLGSDRKPVQDVKVEDWDRVIAVNLRGTFLCTKYAVPYMLRARKGGRIINLSSTSGKFGTPSESAYCASKFGVIGFTQSVARELAGDGITVNAICPGVIATDRVLARMMYETGAALEEAEERFVASRVPRNRAGAPDDIANMVCFLASPQADFITAQAYNVCGGEISH